MREEFEQWLFSMDDVLEQFFSSLPEDIRSELNYSIDSLDKLEAWMLKQFSDPKQLTENKKLHDGLARYIGETYRKNLDNKSKWTIKFDDPKFAFYGLPVIVAKETDSTIICPLTTATTAVAREQGDFMSTILKNNIKKLS